MQYKIQISTYVFYFSLKSVNGSFAPLAYSNFVFQEDNLNKIVQNVNDIDILCEIFPSKKEYFLRWLLTQSKFKNNNLHHHADNVHLHARFVQDNKTWDVQDNQLRVVLDNPVKVVQDNPVKALQNNSVRVLQNNPVRAVQGKPVRTVQERPERVIQDTQAWAVQDNPVTDSKNSSSYLFDNIGMQILGGFMAVAGGAAVAIAFVLLNAATAGVAGIVVATIGAAVAIAGIGLFATGTYKVVEEQAEHHLAYQ